MTAPVSPARRDTPQPLALINARLVCPASGRDETGGVYIENGVVTDLGPHLAQAGPPDVETVDCGGKLLCPGLIDMRVFAGEPGLEHRETLETASRAAAAGGVTTIICMPNTQPVIDGVALVDFIERRARDIAIVNIHPMAAATKGLASEIISEIGLLKSAGAVAFTDGRASVGSAQLMRLLLAYARDFDALVVQCPEESSLAQGGVMNEGEVSSRLGLPGIPDAAETIVLARDVRLVALTGGRYHAAPVSCAGSLDVLRRAKADGLPITCGVSINHLTLNENDIGAYRTYFKLRPPLRREEDRQAMVRGVRDGEIDVIVSGHDPQDFDAKRRPFEEAADGAIGLETLLSAALRLYHNGEVSLHRLLEALSARPAELLGLPGGRLAAGAPADLIVVDLNAPWIVEERSLRSKSKNTPFEDQMFEGRVMMTLVAGRIVYSYADADHA
ncbi:MAG: dihydroorotase [Dichotomicrobium sp.]